MLNIFREAITYLTHGDDSPDIPSSGFPAPLLCVPGTALSHEQLRAKVAFSAGAQALNSFTVDFSFSVAAVREGECYFKPKILSLCNGSGGFRIQLEATRLSLLLFSPTQTLVGELAADFDWKERSDVWTRVTCTLESEKSRQTASLVLDGKVYSKQFTQASSRYQDCEQRFLLLGCGSIDLGLRDLKLWSGAVCMKEMERAWQNELSQEHLAQAAQHHWQMRPFCDCRLVAGDGEVLEAHRSVLSASSPVFLRMFQSDMQEAQGKCEVLLKNSSSADITAFLHFIYMGRLPAEKTFSRIAVMELADMYDIQRLVQLMCVDVEQNLTPETVSETLRFLKRRQESPAVAETYRRVRRKVHGNHELMDGLLDSL